MLWKSLRPNFMWEIPVIGNNYQLLDDIFINLLRNEGDNSVSFNFYALWQQKGVPPTPWHVQTYRGVPILDFICDPSQDLLILALDVQ
jgi:hypothetical protein